MPHFSHNFTPIIIPNFQSRKDQHYRTRFIPTQPKEYNLLTVKDGTRIISLNIYVIHLESKATVIKAAFANLNACGLTNG
jgi:hypothetical protein